MDSVIAAWHHIDPLAVARLLLVQGMLEKELNRVLKAVCRGAIVLRRRFLRIGWFREVVLQNLLPVAQQAALEHVAKLGEALDIVQVDPFGPTDEIRDDSVESKLDSKAARILGDLALYLLLEALLCNL
jgi:hypothetical protein